MNFHLKLFYFFIWLLFFIVILSSALIAQGPDTLWTRTYGGNGNDYGEMAKQTSDEGYILIGNIGGNGGSDLYLVKTDNLGNTIWTKTIGEDTTNDQASSIHQTSDGGYAITASTDFPTGNGIVRLIRTNDMGDTLWTKIFSRDLGCHGGSAYQTTDGGFVIGSTFMSDTRGWWTNNTWFIRTDDQGDTLWTKVYGSLRQEIFCSDIKQTFDGG